MASFTPMCWNVENLFLSSCAFPPGCSCQQLRESLLGGETAQGDVAPAAVKI